MFAKGNSRGSLIKIVSPHCVKVFGRLRFASSLIPLFLIGDVSTSTTFFLETLALHLFLIASSNTDFCRHLNAFNFKCEWITDDSDFIGLSNLRYQKYYFETRSKIPKFTISIVKLAKKNNFHCSYS